MISVSSGLKRSCLALMAGLLLCFPGSVHPQEKPVPSTSTWSISSVLNTALIVAPTVMALGEQALALTAEHQHTAIGTQDLSEPYKTWIQTILTGLNIDPETIFIKKMHVASPHPFCLQQFGVYATNTTLFIDPVFAQKFPFLTYIHIIHAANTQFKNHVYRNTIVYTMGLTASKAVASYYLIQTAAKAVQEGTRALGWNAYTESPSMGMSGVRLVGGLAVSLLCSHAVQYVSNHITRCFTALQNYPVYQALDNKNLIISMLVELFDYAAQYPIFQQHAYKHIQDIMSYALSDMPIHQWQGLRMAYETSLYTTQKTVTENQKHALQHLKEYFEQIQVSQHKE